jgi:hypothetical protein
MKKLLLHFCFLLCLAACGVQEATDSLPTMTPSATHTIAPPTSTLTLTPIPTQTPLPSPSPTATRTPLPRIESEAEALDLISFTGNGSCKLPCWMNIIPGQTDWDDAVFFIQSLEPVMKVEIATDLESVYGRADAIFFDRRTDEIRINGSMGSRLEDNAVYEADLQISSFSVSAQSSDLDASLRPLPIAFSMSSVLREYGVPSIALLDTDTGAPEPLGISILLVYPENQFYIEYSYAARIQGRNVVACQPAASMDMGIVNQKEKLASVEAMQQAPEVLPGRRLEAWQPMEKILGMSNEQFHKRYSSPNSECIIFPVSNWQP